MKKFFKTLTLIAAILTLVPSCGPLESDLLDDFNLNQILKTDIYGKWTISNSRDYKSIEFAFDGYYLVVESDNNVIYGKYSITDESEITLNGFGVIEATYYDDSSLKYDLVLDGETEEDAVSHSTTKEDYTSESDKTFYLSHTWSVGSFDSASTSGADTDIEFVIYTASGTLLIIKGNGDQILAEWKWDNEVDESEIYYSLSTNDDWSSDLGITVEVVNLSYENVDIRYYAADSSSRITYGLEVYSGDL